EQPEILRTVLRKAGRAFGVYCEPVKIGNIETGQLVRCRSRRVFPIIDKQSLLGQKAKLRK
ncbi:hypothetical protein ACSV5K_25085, partial [Agrobacterium pusense]|uniref:hypothetical protein n=1 Tax=Agrobacterium pusense TaxID=648995 RepID=UPI003FD179E8